MLLRRAQQHQGEWVLPTCPPEALPLVGSLRQVLLHQVLLVSLLQAQPHPESPRRVRPAGLLVALPPEVLPLVVPSIRASPPPVLRAWLLASPPQVGQQQAKHQAVESAPQRP